MFIFLNKLFKNFKVKSSVDIPRMSSMYVGYFFYTLNDREDT